jgi:hypothetical protein
MSSARRVLGADSIHPGIHAVVVAEDGAIALGSHRDDHSSPVGVVALPLDPAALQPGSITPVMVAGCTPACLARLRVAGLFWAGVRQSGRL